MPTTFITVPADEALETRSNWTKDGSSYVLVRSHLMIVQSPSLIPKKGPILETISVPAGGEVTSDIKIKQSTKLTEEVARTLESTVATKINQELTTKIKSATSAKLSALESSFESELQARVGLELSESLRDGLTSMRRVEIETVLEDTTTVKFPVQERTTVVKHMMLKGTDWDVYLVGAEAITLEWKRTWAWTLVRKTLETARDNTKRPLFRLTLYEPQTTPSFETEEYTPEINDTSWVDLQPLDGKVPRRKIPELVPLATLAKRAFPTTVETVKAFVTPTKKPSKTTGRKQAAAKRSARAAPASVKKVSAKAALRTATKSSKVSKSSGRI